MYKATLRDESKLPIQLAMQLSVLLFTASRLTNSSYSSYFELGPGFTLVWEGHYQDGRPVMCNSACPKRRVN